jgi:hypothetical protein
MPQAMALAERAMRTCALLHALAREFGRIVATYSLRHPQEEKPVHLHRRRPRCDGSGHTAARTTSVCRRWRLNIALPHEQSKPTPTSRRN